MKTIAIIGMGYVGFPLAVAFSRHNIVIGYDLNKTKIEKYKLNKCTALRQDNLDYNPRNLYFTSNEEELKKASIFIICVPTPINSEKLPDLSALKNASQTVAKYIHKNDIVIYESTVYPGTTDEICIPLLEEISGLKCNTDFKVGYSPERINPGDNIHTLETTTKIVAASDDEGLDLIIQIYEEILTASVFPSSSIKNAEAVKLFENTQRDVNIAFMNEVSLVCKKLDLDISEIIDAMNTKWNALHFYPGLVGGHCIGVDSYYYLFKAESLGCNVELTLASRAINEYMAIYVANQIINTLKSQFGTIENLNITFLGFAFKANCSDIRNTQTAYIIDTLSRYKCIIQVVDYLVDSNEVNDQYGIELTSIENVSNSDCVVLATPHDYYCKMNIYQYDRLFSKKDKKVFFDIMRVCNKKEMLNAGYIYWSL